MRNPLNKNAIYYENKDDINVLKIDNLPQYDIHDWDLYDPKDFKKYISTIERNIRGSFEYKRLIQYLRQNLNMNKCSFYENVNNIDTTGIKIHIHHEPITLYDICVIVFNKRMFFHEGLSEELVAKEVMYLHYSLLVGLIPLAETVHELVHNQFLFVPTDRVFGKYKEFVDMYKEFMTPEQLETLQKIEDYTNTYNSDEYKALLQTNYIYLDLSGAYDIPKMEDVLNMVRDRLSDIKKTNDLINPIIRIK